MCLSWGWRPPAPVERVNVDVTRCCRSVQRQLAVAGETVVSDDSDPVGSATRIGGNVSHVVDGKPGPARPQPGRAQNGIHRAACCFTPPCRAAPLLGLT